MRLFCPTRVLLIGGGLVLAWHAPAARALEQSGSVTFLPVVLAEATVEVAAPPIASQPSPAASQPVAEHQDASPPAPVLPRPRMNPSMITQPLAHHQSPRRAPIRPNGPQPTRRPVKPFDSIHEEPTISPYLNLYREETDAMNAPNYYAFVRPQMEQLETNRLQQREIQRLRAQLQTMPPAAGPQHQQAAAPRAGATARYMDTAQFYSGWQR